MSQTPLDGLGLEELDKDAQKDEYVAGTASFGEVKMGYDPHDFTPSKSIKPFFWRDPEDAAQMAAMANGMPSMSAKRPLMIRTSDKTNYRIYMRTEMVFDQSYVSQLCRFLDGRTDGQTVSFVLGTKMEDWQAHIVGSVISAIEACKAKTTMYAMGYCSIPETMIWCFGNERYVGRYGALTFGQTPIISVTPAYVHYFQQCYDRAQSLGALTAEEATHAKDTGVPIMKLYSELGEFQLR